MNVNRVLELPDGPRKTAAVVAWIQGLFAVDEECPILVGGAAVELYTGGAYTTGDIDLVGSLTPRVERALRLAGFTRHGRHWVHEEAEVFIELPGSALDPEEQATWLETEGQRVRVISAEDLLVDRLGAWQYWQSSMDGVNALQLWRVLGTSLDLGRLEARLRRAGWTHAWQSLRRFAEQWESEGGPPSSEEIERWANDGP